MQTAGRAGVGMVRERLDYRCASACADPQMVDLPARSDRRYSIALGLRGSRARRKRNRLLPEDFRRARYLGAFSRTQAAQLLGVSIRTVNNWENGRVRVSWAAYKLLRLWALYEPPHPDWAGWCIREGVLWSPDGRAFRPGDLYHLRWVFAAARLWHKAAGQRRPAKLLPFPAKPGFAFEVAPTGAVSSRYVPVPKSANDAGR